MKPNPNMLFGNIFDDRKITPTYLVRFADDTIAKLIQNNTSHEFDEILGALQHDMDPLRTELGIVDVNLNSQVDKTATVDEFIVDFKQFMKDKYVNIAAALGGEKATAFINFYPHGKTEYTTITKTKMLTVLQRLKSVATTYQTQLGDDLNSHLQSFETKWNDLRENQLEQKSAVKTNRSVRSQARKVVEITLLKTIHFIGGKYPSDINRCKVFFDFNLLFGVHHTTTASNPNTPSQ